LGLPPYLRYTRLGFEAASNVGLWRYAVELQTERVREALARASIGERESFRVEAEGHFLLVAIRNGLRVVGHLQKYVRDVDLATKLDEFERGFPDERNLRNVLTHMDEYVFDQGRLQRDGKVEEGTSSYYKIEGDDVVLSFGQFKVRLLEIGSAAANLLTFAVEVWRQGIRDNVDTWKEADAADEQLRRDRGMRDQTHEAEDQM
jgi:hypothetical protein